MYSYTNISAILWFRRDIQSLGLLRNVCIRLRSENFGVIFLWNLKIKYWKLSKRIIRLYFMYDKLTLWHARHFAVKLRISHEYSLQILIPRCPAHRGFWLRGVQLIVNSNSAVSSSLWILTPLCPAHRGFWLCGVLLIADSDFVTHHGFWLRGVQLITDSDSAVFSSSRILTLQCPAHRRFWLCGVQLITYSDSTVSWSLQIQTPHCAAHRGFWLRSPSWILTPRCPAQRRFWLWGVLFIADTDSALSFSFRSRKTHSYRKHTWITLIYPFVLRYS